MFEGFIVNGFVTMGNGDGGDSLQRSALLAVAERKSGKQEVYPGQDDIIAISKAEVAPGILVRMPGQVGENSWMSDPKTTSRDQTVSFVMWCGYANAKQLLMRQFIQQVKRFGFYQNSVEIWPDPGAPPKSWYKVDFASPEHWVQYARAFWMCSSSYFKQTFLGVATQGAIRLVATFTDLLMLTSVVVVLVRGYLDADYSDDDNLILSMWQSEDSIDTVTAMLARFLYTFRPTAGYTDEKKTETLRSKGIKIKGSALLWKHRIETGAPPIGKFIVQQGLIK